MFVMRAAVLTPRLLNRVARAHRRQGIDHMKRKDGMGVKGVLPRPDTLTRGKGGCTNPMFLSSINKLKL